MDATLRSSWRLGPLTVPNRLLLPPPPAPTRLLLAPLAGIGNWCIRMQARRHGAGHVVSEMVSSHAIHYGNERTLRELLRIHPDEGPVSVQLFGNDPDIMRSAAARAAEAGAAIIDLNMGCPVPKVCKAGSGAALLKDHGLAVRIARAAGEGSGLPVTVKLRPGQLPGERDGIELAKRLAADAGVVAIALHPRHVSQQHKGRPDYGLARELARELPVPLILSGGLRPTRAEVLAAYEQAEPAAVMLARGFLGNPWLFAEILGDRDEPPEPDEVLDELIWLMDRVEEHMGAERAGRWLRKAYPWFVERMGEGAALPDALQRADGLTSARAVLAERFVIPAA